MKEKKSLSEKELVIRSFLVGKLVKLVKCTNNARRHSIVLIGCGGRWCLPIHFYRAVPTVFKHISFTCISISLTGWSFTTIYLWYCRLRCWLHLHINLRPSVKTHFARHRRLTIGRITSLVYFPIYWCSHQISVFGFHPFRSQLLASSLYPTNRSQRFLLSFQR